MYTRRLFNVLAIPNLLLIEYVLNQCGGLGALQFSCKNFITIAPCENHGLAVTVVLNETHLLC